MPFQIIRDDITKVKCDAIVNAANNTLLGGGGVDGAIHRAAGMDLLRECMTLGSCETGNAKITNGYNLPAKYVIHTVGPIWQGGDQGEDAALRSCYQKSLQLALENGCESVAFPLISSGIYGYPKAAALDVALEEIRAFLDHLSEDMLVYLVVYDRASFEISKQLDLDIQRLIEDENDEFSEQIICCESYICCEDFFETRSSFSNPSLESSIEKKEDPFQEKLFHIIQEKNLDDVDVYKKANLDRKHFSKIRSNVQYRPKKATALALIIALQLDYSEAKDLLARAEFAFSPVNKMDIIVSYCIQNGIFDIWQINSILFKYGEPQLA